jgi:hypothetical protein
VTVGNHLAHDEAPKPQAGVPEHLAIQALFEGLAGFEEAP